MFDIMKSQIENGMPVLATCAGAILLVPKRSTDRSRDSRNSISARFRCASGGMPTYCQLGSFHTETPVAGIGTVPMTFIRAPYIASVGDGVEVLAVVEERIVGVKYKNQMASPSIRSSTRMCGFIRRFWR